jgi:hypothetical protein
MKTYALLMLAALAGNLAAATCESLTTLALPNTGITVAQTVASGSFSPPAGQPLTNLPSFCRVAGVIRPVPESEIQFEVWIPSADWNGKFYGIGNGGYAGSIGYGALANAVRHGYAAASTDTGHTGAGDPNAAWALGHPQKTIDFGYRAIHETAVKGKAIAAAFYGSAVRHAYFNGCSNGGRQALMEAQRYPEDYDGILAGAPANYWTHLLASALYDAQTTTLDPLSYIPTSKIPTIAKAVNAACDAKDGVTDGILNDPRQCHFDPATLLCKAADSDACLMQPQVTALEKLYVGPHDSGGKEIFPGFLPGGEDGGGGWPLWITGTGPGKSLLFAFGEGFFSDMVYDKADWDYKKAKLDEAVATADRKFSGVLNATETNMKPFESRGGKLIVYHGWNDAAISALNTIHYYESVESKMGKQDRDSFLRLFMVPGMQHCGGGPGPDIFGQMGFSTANDPQHNMYLALEQWVENGTAPNTVIATKQSGGGAAAAVKMTRPLCAYPQVAKYKGSGDTNDAANFVCGVP